MQLAREMQEDPEICAIFASMGKYGLPTAEDVKKLDRFRERYIEKHALMGKGIAGFLAVVPLLRGRFTGEFPDLDCPAALEFLLKDRERNIIRPSGGGIITVPASAEEVMQLANAMLQNEKISKYIYNSCTNKQNFSDQAFCEITDFQYSYRKKYWLENRAIHQISGEALSIARQVFEGKIDNLSSPEAWDLVKGRLDV